MRPLPKITGCVLAGLASTVLVASGSGSSAAPAPVASSGTVRAVAKEPTLSHLRIAFSRRSASFDQPVQVVAAVDGSARLFVVEKRGLVRVYAGHGKIQRAPYLDIRSRVLDNGEEGLLGIAFPVNFPTTRHFWVSYVAKNGSLQVSRFTARSAKATTVAASTERKVLNVPHPTNTNHNGGSLAFGTNGYLYIGTGDGGGAGDAPNNAQNKRVLLGKILRIDVQHSCSGRSYCVPASNPYAKSSTARHEIWAIGLRNPWRTSVDPRTGALWIGDVGQDRYEEIDRIPAGSGGWNMGWSCYEATHHYKTNRCVSGARYHGPVASYTHAFGDAVIGGVVYRGRSYAKLIAGRYVYGDNGSGRIWLRGTSGATRVVGSLPGITSFGVTGSGEVYAVTLAGGLYAMTVRQV